MTEETVTLEKTFNKAYDTVAESCKEGFKHCESRIHQSPASAVLIAASIGYAASVLPVCRIGGALARLGFALAKPTLLVIGILKVLECVEKKSSAAKQVEGLEREREPLIDSPTGPPQG